MRRDFFLPFPPYPSRRAIWVVWVGRGGGLGAWRAPGWRCGGGPGGMKWYTDDKMEQRESLRRAVLVELALDKVRVSLLAPMTGGAPSASESNLSTSLCQNTAHLSPFITRLPRREELGRIPFCVPNKQVLAVTSTRPAPSDMQFSFCTHQSDQWRVSLPNKHAGFSFTAIRTMIPSTVRTASIGWQILFLFPQNNHLRGQKQTQTNTTLKAAIQPQPSPPSVGCR